MPRGDFGRTFRNRQQSDDSRTLRECSNYVRANQRLHSQLLESIMSNERNMFSLINQSYTPMQRHGLSQNVFDSPITETPFVSTGAWSLFSTPPLLQRQPLTLTEIDTATQYRTYGSIPDEQQRYPTCPITMNAFEDNTIVMQIQACGHYFNPHSLRTHLSTQDTCPYCRHNSRESLLEVVGNGIPTNNTSGNVADASGNMADASGNIADASGNMAINSLNASVFYHIANNTSLS